MNQVYIAALIFLLTYILIISERIHRTTAALLGGMGMILFGVLRQEEALRAVDFNVIFLLTGMMMLAFLLGETGIFQWMAVKAVRLGRGDPVVIMILISLITGISSAFLDNVTVVVLIAPITFYLASTLNISPIPFLIANIMASNIGGAATLIGDPPNILIGSAAGIDFTNFLVNMGPPTILSLIAFIPLIVIFFRDKLHVSKDIRREVMRLDTREIIQEPRLLAQSLVVLIIVIVGFLFQSRLHLEPATIALSGATLMLLWTRRDPIKLLENVEWTTLMFFVGLFITVEAIVKVGLIEEVAARLILFTRGDQNFTTLFLLWFSAFASGIVDNIPYTAAMIPIVEDLGESLSIQPLWWSLALGADFGGNLTIIGASANVIVASLAERSEHKIYFFAFFRYGIVVVITTLIISTIWIWLRYL
jgi:Na+/H+ antiporter NhaD/arsenite permease-like protein